MIYDIGSPLPEYRVKANRGNGEPCNLMCDDTHARRFGYRSGLVPGVSIYAYMSRSAVELWGKEWLDRGGTEITFDHPVYEGEEIKVTGSLTKAGKEGVFWFDYQAENPQGMTCGRGTGILHPCAPEPAPTLADYPDPRRPLRRPIALESLKVGERLTAVTSEFNRKTHWEYCEKTIRDHHPVYRQHLHPGWILSQADLILTANFDMPPWVHVSSAVQNFRAQGQESAVETRGSVREKFELRGNHFIVLDVAVFAESRCLSTIRHTAIFRVASRVA